MTIKNEDDNQIEQLLSSMPDINDHRPKSDILVLLKQDERLQPPRRNNKKKWMPALVTVAALLVLSLLIPSMLQGNEGAMQDKVTEPMITRSLGPEMSANDTANTEGAMEAKQDAATAFSADLGIDSHVVLPDELHGMQPFRIGMAHAATVIPVTFLIPDEKLTADFPAGKPDSVALYNKYAITLPETDLGFDDYHPYQGKLNVQKQSVVHTVPNKHNIDLASATYSLYANSMRETFTDFTEFKTVDEKGNAAVFDHVGTMKPVEMKRQLPYFKYVMPSGEYYLIPYESGHSDTAKDALASMNKTSNDIVEALVPEKIGYDVDVKDGIATVIFKEQLDLSLLEPSEAIAMIEGFMLTAQNYQLVVKIDNTKQRQFGKYDLSSVLPEPIGVNPMNLP